MVAKEKQKQWVLDGYNIMHALHKLEGFSSFELARERFIAWVEQFQSLGDKEITLVFDSNRTFDTPPEIHPRLRVIYSQHGFTADGIILNIIRQCEPKQRPRWTVVTRDLGLRDTLFSYRCVVISPEAFLKEYYAYQQSDAQRQVYKKHINDHFYRPFDDFFEKD